MKLCALICTMRPPVLSQLMPLHIHKCRVCGPNGLVVDTVGHRQTPPVCDCPFRECVFLHFLLELTLFKLIIRIF